MFAALANMNNATVQEFMQGPLVAWIRRFKEEPGTSPVDLVQLTDGVFLDEVLSHIWPECKLKEIANVNPRPRRSVSAPEDVSGRIRNLEFLIRCVRSFYEEGLGQLVVTRLPDPVILGREINNELALADLKLLLLLVLGCAVQGPRKEAIITDIKQLPVETQHAIVECIQQVSDNPETVWSKEWCELALIPDDQQEALYRLLVQHVRRLIRERDEYAQQVTKLVLQDLDKNHPKLVTNNNDKHHAAVELADLKAKLRKLRQELEEKSETLAECKEELEANKATLAKLRQENLELIQDARAAKSYRDELDIVRERAQKVDRLEAELQRYRDRIADIDFYKSRVEELREDNRLLEETKDMLESQLESARKRADHLLDLEADILKYKTQVNNLLMERDADRERLQELMEDNAHLHLCAKNSLSESASLVAELDSLKTQTSDLGKDSLSDQLGYEAMSRVRKLELENQRLMGLISNMKESSFHENADKILELEKENKRLSLKINQMMESGQKEKQHTFELEVALDNARLESAKWQETLEVIKTNSERLQGELEVEKELLCETVETLRERQTKSQNQRLQEAETESRELRNTSQQLQLQLSRLQAENQQLTKFNQRLKESAERLAEVEHHNHTIEREKQELQQSLANLREACETHAKWETELSVAESERKHLTKTVENMKQLCAKMDSATADNAKLAAENQRLHRALESFKQTSQRVMDAEQEKEELVRNNQQLTSSMEALKVERGRMEELELQGMSLTSEHQKLQRTCESVQRRLEESERLCRDVETENGKLHKTLETLKASNRRLNELEKETTELEADNHRLERESQSLSKEVSRLKQAAEVKDVTIDEVTSRASTFERDNKRLQKEVELLQMQNSRLHELEKENRELLQQSAVEKRTLSALREELVSEKIKTQQLNNELEKLSADLQRLGLNRELIVSTPTEDRYLALESMLEGTLKRSLEVKEERILALESRLEESTARNAELRDSLRAVQREKEALQQRLLETSSENNHSIVEREKEHVNTRRELTVLKDQLNEIERQNASLVSEKENFKQQLNAAQAAATQTTASSQTVTLQWQQRTAALQVENTALESRCGSLQTQLETLQATQTQLEAEKEKVSANWQEVAMGVRDFLLRVQPSLTALNLHEDLQSRHDQLSKDQEQLQKLHEQLSSEYDALSKEREALKVNQKEVKAEYKALQERLHTVETSQEDVLRIKAAFEVEKEALQADSRSLSNLRAEHSRLKDDFRSLFVANEKLKAEYKNLQTDYKALKTDNNTLKLKQTEMQGELAECRDQINIIDIDLSKANNKCEMLSQMNNALEEDRRTLMTQVSLLLAQYHDLLTQTLEEKDHFHVEEKNLADKVNNLKRQKEKLEEKIMEQYRRMENNTPKSRRSFGSNLVRKMRKASSDLISKVPRGRSRSRSRLDGTECLDTNDSSSLGSGGTESLDSGSERQNSPQDLSLSDTSGLLGDLKVDTRRSNLLNTAHFRQSLPPGALEKLESTFRDSVPAEALALLQNESNESHSDSNSISSIKGSSYQRTTSSNGASLPLSKSVLSLGTAGSRQPLYVHDKETELVNGKQNSPPVPSTVTTSITIPPLANGKNIGPPPPLGPPPLRRMEIPHFRPVSASNSPPSNNSDPTFPNGLAGTNKVDSLRTSPKNVASLNSTPSTPRPTQQQSPPLLINGGTATSTPVHKPTNSSSPPTIGTPSRSVNENSYNGINTPPTTPQHQHVVKTTNINVSITSPFGGSSTPSLERRASMRLPASNASASTPRPLPRTLTLDDTLRGRGPPLEDRNNLPPLPARNRPLPPPPPIIDNDMAPSSSHASVRPQLPPRLNTAPTTSLSPTNGVPAAGKPKEGEGANANSIWYEYGCV